MQKIKELIALFFYNQYEEGVQQQIQEWIAGPSFTNEKEEALEEIWDSLNITADASTIASYTTFCRNKKTNSSSRRMLHRMLRLSAVLIIPLLIAGTVLYYFKKENPDELVMVEQIVPNGKLLKITLSDSSVVTVNSGSHIQYPKKFTGTSRVIYLNGQANFQVKKDRYRPFIVKTDHFNIEVLGTVFDVCAYKQNDQISTALISGKVRVKFNNNEASPVVLNPYEQVVFDRVSKDIHINQLHAEDISSWKESRLVFYNATLNDIKSALERKYDIKIHYQTHKYQHEIFTVKFIHNESLQDCLQILQYIIPGFRYQIKDKEVFIY